eukprot:9266150-Lingulodinium_polyedra.AAC.1
MARGAPRAPARAPAGPSRPAQGTFARSSGAPRAAQWSRSRAPVGPVGRVCGAMCACLLTRLRRYAEPRARAGGAR